MVNGDDLGRPGAIPHASGRTWSRGPVTLVAFKLTHGAKSVYARDERHKDELLKKEFAANAKVEVSRFKGLGEMDGEELWETTLDPTKRMLMKVQMEDALKADEMFRILMGEKVEPRREFIQKHALEVTEIDYHGA